MFNLLCVFSDAHCTSQGFMVAYLLLGTKQMVLVSPVATGWYLMVRARTPM